MPQNFDQKHIPVLLSEVLEGLNLHPEGIYVDCTFGRGGHSRAILEHLGTNGQLLALDQDPEAVMAAQNFQDPRFELIHSSFEHLTPLLQLRDWQGQVQGILLDLGVSSPQLDNALRGFSFMHEGPLDMRMNPQQGEAVGSWLSQASFEDIAQVLKTYGEERYARRIARAIVSARGQKELTTTQQLAEIISTAHPAWKRDKHPATQSFLALRIFINRELEQLKKVLAQIPHLLAPQGRLVVISFHSLEDRIVKRFIKEQARGDFFPPHLPITMTALCPTLRPLGKAIFPSAGEIANNPRARSAVLRVAERL